MKIEILYPELCDLFGDMGNTDYLRASLPEAEFIRTGLTETPRFASEQVDLLYLGSATERAQELMLQRLLPLRERLKALVEAGTVMLLTGNACELFAEAIETEDGREIPALGLISGRAKRHIPQRFNSLYLGKFGETDIVGYTSRFSHLSGLPAENALFTTVKGLGPDPDAKSEGFRLNNVFGTYLLGPLLVLNPDFTAYLMRLLGAASSEPAFYAEAKQAFEIRLEEYRGDIGFGFHA